MRCLVNLSVFVFAILPGIPSLWARNVSAGEPKLKFAVILTRHGVRSPIWTPQQLNAYSSDPWPNWGVPPGNLTPQGSKLMTLFGSYYHLYFSADGLLHAAGCEDAGHIHIRADAEQRTRDTARSLADGMLPGCDVEVQTVGEGKDPLFTSWVAGVGKPDRALAAASISGRIGANPTALAAIHRHAFDTLREVLFSCAPDASCSAEDQPGKQSLLKQPSVVEAGKGDHAADLQGPLRTGSTLAEDFLLEYASGMDGKELGWGRLDAAKLLEVMRIHAAYADLARQTPYIARLQ